MNDDDKKRMEAQQQQPEEKIKQIMAAAAAKKGVDNNQAENRLLLQVGKHVTDASRISIEQEAEQRAERATLQRADAGETGAV
jgi:hypothetical protein